MKSFILDTCTIINLYNAGILSAVLELNGIDFHIGELVLDECSKNLDQKSFIERCINSGCLYLIEELPLDEILLIKNKYILGIGESESLALALKHGINIATDDKKARTISSKLLGKERLSGSIYFIKSLIQEGKIDCDKGLLLIDIMKKSGGFLPKMHRNSLCD